MAIRGILQPEIIDIDDTLRLRRFDGNYDFALEWYKDEETVYLVDGKREPYTYERLTKMYKYLDSEGELYFIELYSEGEYKPIGDVTLCTHDMPIVIGDKNYRAEGIGKRVVGALIERGRTLGFKEFFIHEIYDYNEGSQRLFMSMGFDRYKKTDKGHSYRLIDKHDGR